MRALLQNLFGIYTPIMSGDVVADGFAGVDWEYVLGVLGFYLVLYCIFRIFGLILGGRK